MTEPTDKALPDEQQLDDYLKGDSSVSRRYRQLDSVEVPAALDSLVLRQAADAVKPSRARRPAWMRWSAGLAAAACTVLVLSIVLETGLQDRTMVVNSPAPVVLMEAQRREVAPRPEAPAMEMPSFEAPVEMRLPEVPPASFAVDPAPAVESVPLPQVAAPPPPAAAPSPAPAAALAERALADTEAAGVAREEKAASAARATQQASESDASRAELEEAIVTANKRQRRPGQGVGPRDSVVVSGMTAERAYSQAISANVPPPRHYVDPEEWLKDIRQLRKDDKQEEADREWRRFLAAFPNHVVATDDPARETKK